MLFGKNVDGDVWLVSSEGTGGGIGVRVVLERATRRCKFFMQL